MTRSAFLYRLNQAALILIAVGAVVYAGDYLSLRFRIPGNRPQLASVSVQPLLAVPQKNGKYEFMLGDQVSQTCSNSLFPQLGYAPCWYVNRHKQPQIKM
jgi:hypothetical protein